ncbi:hypothetical protein PtB15_7B87 [Puccinia triticina]|nr:hypothetical protein PtB15_7B87 [Puccinia triticina]
MNRHLPPEATIIHLPPAEQHPQNSLVVEDYDERYGFSSSEESSGLLDDHLETTRILKRRQKISNPFSASRRAKRKDSIHDIDHNTPAAKYALPTRRPTASTTQRRRWMRWLASCGLSLRSLRKLSEQREFPHELADSLEPVNVFVGVFSVDSAYERRHLIRSTYARHSRPIDPNTGQIAHNVQLKFILGRPRIQHVRRVALEMETYNDIVVLEIQENMNRGKTYAFLNWASQNATIPVYFHPLHEPKPKTGVNGIGGVRSPDPIETVNVGVGFKKADFIVKADDDSFIVLSELERHLRVAPRTMTYWGYLIRNLFMGGECYALSADLVRYVASSPKVLDHVTGAEDKKVAKWMRIHPNASQINWVTERCWIYDHPKAGTTYAHGFLFPDEVKRVRAEGRVGLSEAEIEARGAGRAQSYSTVNKWKERYVAPKSMMTMEEEVEALVEGGGRFTKTDWKRPTSAEDMVPLDKVVFESGDERLLKSSLIGGPASIKASSSSSSPRPGEYTPPVRDHYEEPSLKFGRPPNELMAKMPAMEDLPESPLKDKIRQGMTAEGSAREDSETESQKNSTVTTTSPAKFVPSPTLRFDPEEIRLREARFLNLPHGGTVVVHYLKRSEWFLETSLILLGRAKTWDDGLIPLVYEPAQQIRAGRPASGASEIQPEGHSVVVSEKAGSSASSNALSTVDDSQTKTKTTTGSSPGDGHQKKIALGRLAGWGKFDRVEEIQVGGFFGGARLAGSPVIDQDGTIREGRRPKLSPSPVAPAAHPSSLSVVSPTTPEPSRQKSPATVDDDEEDPKEVKNEIRKTQFGGAGWIRGKPRLRVADHTDGPRFDAAPSPSSPSAAGDEPDAPPLLQDQQQPSEDEFLFQGRDDSLVLASPPIPQASTEAASLAFDPLSGTASADLRLEDEDQSSSDLDS